MLITDTKGAHEFELRIYQRENGAQFTLITIKTNLTRLGGAAEEINAFCIKAVNLFRRIYLDKELER
jgi:hypothetical protein